jgi:hypothetical protein
MSYSLQILEIMYGYIVFVCRISSDAMLDTRLGRMWCESRLEGVNRAKLKLSKIITTTSRVSVRNIIESTRERVQNKSQANNEVRHADLFYRGLVLSNLLPVEEATKAGSLSTLTLPQTVPRTE